MEVKEEVKEEEIVRVRLAYDPFLIGEIVKAVLENAAEGGTEISLRSDETFLTFFAKEYL